jgi:hypothetical protein
MIPVSVSDILKILDQIPIWKAVVNLPKRVAELERAVAELRDKQSALVAKPIAPRGRECSICGATMKVTGESDHPDFGFAGMKVHSMECPECGHKTTQNFSAGKGYL